jgi:hypothetical protein
MILSRKPSGPNLKQDASPKRTWWNRPLFGQRSLLERLRAPFHRELVSDSALALHQTLFQELSAIAIRANGLDNAKFGSPEFRRFLEIERQFALGKPGYEGLRDTVNRLNAGITAHRAFTGIEQMEFTYRGLRFSDLYAYIDHLCAQRPPAAEFRASVQTKVAEVAGVLKSDEGRQALKQYAMHLDSVGNHQLSLNLLYAFKQLKLQNYTIFKTIADIIAGLRRQDLTKLDNLTAQVLTDFAVFDALAKVIGVPEPLRTPKTYGRLLQYMAMIDKHRKSFDQFKGLVAQLEEWHRKASRLMALRQEYPATDYHLPRPFTQPLPGEDLYRKYQDYLDAKSS